MKRRPDDRLTRLANAAFRRAARKVIERAEATGTPVIVCVNGEVRAVPPRAVKTATKRVRQPRRAGRRAD
jgi:hypothetical protein